MVPIKTKYLGKRSNPVFDRLWNEVPNVYTYRGYVVLMNDIDSCRQADDGLYRLLSEKEEEVLTKCLDKWAEIMQIPTTEEEYDQVYK